MKFLITSALAAASVFAIAQAQDVPSGTYQLDPTHTTVAWSVSHGGFSFYRGTFDEVEGTIEWNADKPTKSSLNVSIDANSVDSPAAVSHADNNNFQEDIAKNALGAEAQPNITFTSKRLKKTGDTEGVIIGDLSFNGQTKEVELEVSLVGSGDFMGAPRMGFAGETTIDRTEWGSDAWTQFGVGTDVTISIQSEFAKVN